MVCFPISWELTITSQSSSLFNIFQKVFLPLGFHNGTHPKPDDPELGEKVETDILRHKRRICLKPSPSGVTLFVSLSLLIFILSIIVLPEVLTRQPRSAPRRYTKLSTLPSLHV